MDDRLPGKFVWRRRLGSGWNCHGRIPWGKTLTTVGRVLIAIAAIFFGVQHFLHPLGLPGVPLEKEMSTWVPFRAFIDYLTGAGLIVAGICFLLARKTRIAATSLGAWIVLLVVVIYGPVLIGALADPKYRAESRGAQLLRRHAPIWRNHSFACPLHSTRRMNVSSSVTSPGFPPGAYKQSGATELRST